jgi:hypothetical protein
MAKQTDEGLTNLMDTAFYRFHEQCRSEQPATAAPPAPNGEGGNADASTSASAPPTLVCIGRRPSLSEHRSAAELGSAAAEECKKRLAEFEWYAPTGMARTEAARWLWANLHSAGEIHTIAIMEKKTNASTRFLLWVPRDCMPKKQDIRLAVELALVPLAASKRTAEHAPLDQPVSKRASRGRSS